MTMASLLLDSNIFVFAVEENVSFHFKSSYFLLKTPYLPNISGELPYATNAVWRFDLLVSELQVSHVSNSPSWRYQII